MIYQTNICVAIPPQDTYDPKDILYATQTPYRMEEL